MKVVIDIPEELLKTKKYVDYFGCLSAKLIDVLESGTPLPKGHGAIKDVSQIKIPFFDGTYEKWVQVAINSAPTIIEAEKAESEE